MKKIVGIMAAAALATSAFAIDFNGQVKLKSNVVSANSDTFKMLDLDQSARNSEDDNLIKFSVGDDLAGASVNFGIADGTVVGGWNTIWLKPIDSLTITAGRPWMALSDPAERMNDQVTGRNDLGWFSNGRLETADWNGSKGKAQSATDKGANATGYAAEFKADALYIGAFLGAPYGNAWFDNDKLGVTAAKFAYTADFGAIQAFFGYNGQFGNPAYTKGSKKTDAILGGAGFYSAFSDTFKINLDAGVQYVKDAKELMITKDDGTKAYSNADTTLYFAAYVGLTFDALEFDFGANFKTPTEDVKETMSSLVEAQVAYRLENAKVALFVMSDNILSKANNSDNPMSFQIVPYVEGNFGALNYNVGAQFNIKTEGTDAEKFNFAIPAVLRVNF